ncbi:hypothetical protein [Paractinoplanes abujensis]|uniref:Uncharacterized protein n=1 Tax=Paractinoplanes abujensis TaxID=882441 RepID=A0A7W7FXY3_9ACTN|nr:hypothetical protein [Actinoplanes abujensis]MBB4690413.1 hypothetical protein [Actinoplanes abujensis]
MRRFRKFAGGRHSPGEFECHCQHGNNALALIIELMQTLSLVVAVPSYFLDDFALLTTFAPLLSLAFTAARIGVSYHRPGRRFDNEPNDQQAL